MSLGLRSHKYPGLPGAWTVILSTFCMPERTSIPYVCSLLYWYCFMGKISELQTDEVTSIHIYVYIYIYITYKLQITSCTDIWNIWIPYVVWKLWHIFVWFGGLQFVLRSGPYPSIWEGQSPGLQRVSMGKYGGYQFSCIFNIWMYT